MTNTSVDFRRPPLSSIDVFGMARGIDIHAFSLTLHHECPPWDTYDIDNVWSDWMLSIRNKNISSPDFIPLALPQIVYHQFTDIMQGDRSTDSWWIAITSIRPERAGRESLHVAGLLVASALALAIQADNTNLSTAAYCAKAAGLLFDISIAILSFPDTVSRISSNAPAYGSISPRYRETFIPTPTDRYRSFMERCVVDAQSIARHFCSILPRGLRSSVALLTGLNLPTVGATILLSSMDKTAFSSILAGIAVVASETPTPASPVDELPFTDEGTLHATNAWVGSNFDPDSN